MKINKKCAMIGTYHKPKMGATYHFDRIVLAFLVVVLLLLAFIWSV